MSNERRRYFRINEKVGISYQIIEEDGGVRQPKKLASDYFELICEKDSEIETLIMELEEENPKVARLMSLLNQKIERVISYAEENDEPGETSDVILKEANVSACGIAFITHEKVVKGTRIALDLMLYPEDIQISTKGFIVACDPVEDSGNVDDFCWRVDFFNMSEHSQETLIQHIVQSQSAQLQSKWNEDNK